MLCLVPLRPWLLLLLLTAHGSADDLAIRWWHFYGADTWPVMQRLVAEFETTHPGIDIFPEYQGSYDMLSRKLLAAIVAGGPPELCTLGCGEVMRFAETGWLAPVQLSSADQTDFFPAVLDAFTHNGQLWALPVEGAAYVLYWNRTLFREAGLPDRPPDTWEELCEFGRALTRDVDGDGRADHWGFARYDKELVGASTIFNLYFANEAPLLEGGAARIDVPEVVDVLRFWQSLETEHGITAPSLPPQAIQRGLVGMWIGGTFSYPALASHLDLGLASIPPLRQTACLAGPDTVVLGKTDTAHESAAQEFLRWLTAPEQAARLCTNLGYLPLRHSVLQHPEFTAFLHTHPAYRSIQDVMAHFKTKPAHPVWSEIQDALNTAREQVEWGRASPEAAAQTAQQAAQRALARYQQEQAPAPARTSGLLVVCGAALAAAAFWLRKNRDHSDSRDNRNRHEKIESFPPSHLPTFPPSHLPTFSRSHLPTFSRSQLPTFSRSHLPTFSRSHLPTFSPVCWFVLPHVTLFLFFTAGPLLAGLLLSLCRWDVLRAPVFVGLGNYFELARDPAFRAALGRTLLWVALTVPVNMALALGVALLLNVRGRARGLFRLLLFTPNIVSVVALGVVWWWILNGPAGLLNYVLECTRLQRLLDAAGIGQIDWLQDPRYALFGVVLTEWWRALGAFLVFLAALQGMPPALYESAALDGAGAWQRFRFITWPLLAPVTFFVAAALTIDTFHAFDQIYTLSGGTGGPESSTTTLSFYLYENAFVRFRMGYAAAIAHVTAALLLLLLLVQRRCFTAEIQP